MASYVLYSGLLAFCWILALLADRYNNKKCVWVIVTALTLVAGLRAYSVGLDTDNYIEKFTYIQNGTFQYAYGLEESFKYFCYAILRIFPHYSALLTVLALISNALIIWRLWDFRKVASFGTMVACYYMGFYFMSLNTMRQFCAIAIILYASKYLMKHQILRYIVGVLVASLFHQSALLGMSLLAFELLRWKQLSKKQKWFFAGIGVLSPVLIYYVLQRVQRYESYFSTSSADVGIMVPVKILFFLVSALFVFIIYKKERHFENWQEMTPMDKNHILLGSIGYAIGLFLIFASYFLPVLNRVGWYFTMYESVYLAMMVKTKHPIHKYVFGLCAVVIVGYGFINAMTDNAQGMMPYLFVWQQ